MCAQSRSENGEYKQKHVHKVVIIIHMAILCIHVDVLNVCINICRCTSLNVRFPRAG